MPQKEEVVRELIENFEEELQSNAYLEDFGRIGEFLSQQHLVDVRARELEANLVARLQGRLSAATAPPDGYVKAAQLYFKTYNFRGPGQQNTDEMKNYSHLLSDELASVENASGFTTVAAGMLGSGKKVDVMVSNLDSATFLKEVGMKRHWKDPGAPPDHGDFTHRIQWYLITKAGFLTHPVGDVFAETSKYTKTIRGGVVISVWFCLVDRSETNTDYGTKDSTDFRCPEHLNKWLIAQINNFPLLSSFLDNRRKKRMDYNVQDYLAAKLYQKRRFDELSHGQQQNVTAISRRSDYILER
jgi:hypothetical protein